MEYFKQIILAATLSLPILNYAQDYTSPAKEALQLFNRYKPIIERKNDAIVQDPDVFTGDINGDGLPDCIV